MSKLNRDKKGREQPVTLAPLSFGEAVDALLKVKPDEDRPKKRGKKRPEPVEREQGDD